MTHDEIIAVVTAHRDGKRIEVACKGGKEWGVMEPPPWDFQRFNYRVKREPREFWLEKEGGAYIVWVIDPSHCSCPEGSEVIHVREVLE